MILWVSSSSVAIAQPDAQLVPCQGIDLLQLLTLLAERSRRNGFHRRRVSDIASRRHRSGMASDSSGYNGGLMISFQLKPRADGRRERGTARQSIFASYHLVLGPGISPNPDTTSPVQQTPVTSEAFAALRCMIECETRHLDRGHQHIMEKALNAGERAMAECGLLSEEKQALRQQNSEKKTRASARSTVVGTAKVMSYEDIVEARRRQEARASSGGRRKEVSDTGRIEAVALARKSEMQKAAQDIQESGLRNYCHVFPW